MQRLKSATKVKTGAVGSQATRGVAVLLNIPAPLEQKIQRLSETTRIPRKILAAEAIRRGVEILSKCA